MSSSTQFSMCDVDPAIPPSRAKILEEKSAAKEPLKRAVEDVLKRAAKLPTLTGSKTEVSIVGDFAADDFTVLVEIGHGKDTKEFAEVKSMVLEDENVQLLLSQGHKLEFEELVREGVAQ